jgi:hypothetical protein
VSCCVLRDLIVTQLPTERRAAAITSQKLSAARPSQQRRTSNADAACAPKRPRGARKLSGDELVCQCGLRFDDEDAMDRHCHVCTAVAENLRNVYAAKTAAGVELCVECLCA